jgi:hypothetical protein
MIKIQQEICQDTRKWARFGFLQLEQVQYPRAVWQLAHVQTISLV